MDEAGEKLKRAFTGAFALLFAVIVLCAVFCNQNVFGTQKMCIRDRLICHKNPDGDTIGSAAMVAGTPNARPISSSSTRT